MSDLHKHLEERHHNGAREYSPSAGRNIPPLVEVLSRSGLKMDISSRSRPERGNMPPLFVNHAMI